MNTFDRAGSAPLVFLDCVTISATLTYLTLTPPNHTPVERESSSRMISSREWTWTTVDAASTATTVWKHHRRPSTPCLVIGHAVRHDSARKTVALFPTIALCSAERPTERRRLTSLQSPTLADFISLLLNAYCTCTVAESLVESDTHGCNSAYLFSHNC